MIKNIDMAVFDSKKKIVKSFIAGKWENGESKIFSDVKNPSNEENLYRVYDVSESQIKRAFRAARKAQEYWHFEVIISEKEKIFQKLNQLLEENREELVRAQIKEGGRLWKFADAEVGGALRSLWHYHGEISRANGDFSRCQMKDKAAITVREPYGVILGITPWNSTLVLPARKIFAALAGGNAIIIKDPTETPLALSLLCCLFQQALEDVLGKCAKKVISIFQVLHGKGSIVGKMLVEEGDYDKATFTGSREVGSYIAEIAGKRIKPVGLELGGHGAMILMDDFDVDRAVSEAVNAACGDSGQRCVALRAVFVHKKVYGEFLKKYVTKVKSLKVGDPADKKTDMPPLINESALKNVLAAVEKSRKSGARVVTGGKRIGNRGYFMAPTVLINVNLRTISMKQEIFGPVLSVMPFSGKTREEALMNAVDMVNASNYGLSNAVLTNDINLAMKAMEKIRTGILYIGRGTTGAEEGKPFGGIKDSGFGREAAGLDEVTYLKQVYVDYHGKPRHQIERCNARPFSSIQSRTLVKTTFPKRGKVLAKGVVENEALGSVRGKPRMANVNAAARKIKNKF